VVNNVEPEPELTTCADWDIVYDCAPGTTLTPETETVIGFTQSECCRFLTCGEWDLDLANDCAPGTTLTPPETEGYSVSECCS